MSRRLILITLTILIGGCGGGSDDNAASSSSLVTTVEAPTSTVAGNDLADVLMDKPPEPYVVAPDSLPSGPFDIDSFIETYSTAEDEDRALLKACGLRRGISRLWIDEEAGRGLGVFVFECSSETAANRLGEGFDELDRQLKEGTADFAVGAVPEAQGRTYLEEVEAGQVRVDAVWFVRGSRLYVTLHQSDSKEGHQEIVLEFASRQATAAR